MDLGLLEMFSYFFCGGFILKIYLPLFLVRIRKGIIVMGLVLCE